MPSWNHSNLRHDVLTAAEIDHGLAMQNVAGPAVAYHFLLQRRVPLAIIKRVLSSPNCRRPLGGTGLGQALS